MSKSVWSLYPAAAWKTAIACFIGMAFGPAAIFAGTWPLFVSPISEEFGWERATLFAVFGVSVLLGPLALPFVGRLADRFGLRVVALPATMVYGLGMIGLSQATGSKLQLALLFVLVGLSGFIGSLTIYSKAISYWFEQHRGLALGLVLGGATSIGPFIAIPIVQWGIAHYGWRNSYIGLGVAVLVMALPALYFWLIEPPRKKAGEAATAADESLQVGLTMSQALRTREFWFVLFGIFLGASVVTGFKQDAVAIYDWRGYSATLAAYALALQAGMGFVGQSISGYLLDRVKRANAVAAVFAGLPLLGLLLIHYLPSSVVVLMMGSILLGIGGGAEFGFAPFLCGRFFGLRAFSEIQGYNMMLVVFGTGLTPILIEVMSNKTHDFTAALNVLQIGLAIGVLLLALLPKYRFEKMALKDGIA